MTILVLGMADKDILSERDHTQLTIHSFSYLLSGEAFRKNHALTDEELEAGQILLCQTYPLNSIVTVQPINQPRII